MLHKGKLFAQTKTRYQGVTQLAVTFRSVSPAAVVQNRVWWCDAPGLPAAKNFPQLLNSAAKDESIYDLPCPFMNISNTFLITVEKNMKCLTEAQKLNCVLA